LYYHILYEGYLMDNREIGKYYFYGLMGRTNEQMGNMKFNEQTPEQLSMIYQLVFEESLEGLILWNDFAEIIEINQTACELFKFKRNDLIGKSLIELRPDTNSNKQELLHLLDNFRNARKHKGIFKMYDSEDSFRCYEYSAIHHIYENINFLVVKDVTEKIEIENRLKKSDTLNVVGELAAGIAHEIRNPMTALKGFIQLLQGEIQEDRSLYFQVILSELNRIDSIINEFLILAKPQVVKYTRVDLIQIMKETVELLSAQAALFNVQIDVQYDTSLPSVFCEPNQLKKVFVNMIKNAIEVMQNGGMIKILIENDYNRFVHISIQDQGSGIPVEKLKKLGEPFYTTKERGTGLGLMVSYKIIEEHKGRIEVESQESVGTTFHIHLPVESNP
jgi:two-component system, sporulation sensor kinase E